MLNYAFVSKRIIFPIFFFFHFFHWLFLYIHFVSSMPADTTHDFRLPGESPEYRAARNELLASELELRNLTAKVAAQRRALPAGPSVDRGRYLFQPSAPDGAATDLVDLFDGNKSLMVYGLMLGPDDKDPCFMCTSFVGTLNAAAPQLADRCSIAVVVNGSVEQARYVSWGDLSYNNTILILVKKIVLRLYQLCCCIFC
jgi:hypothetical protein